jgi:hypothetical protein
MVRNVGKWVLVTLVTSGTGAVAASCGGSNNSSTFVPNSGEGNDATTGGDGQMMGHSDSSFGGGDSPTGCMPKTCAQLGFNCGKAVTCGMLINCNANGSDAGPDCPPGETCGASMPNVCGSGTGGDGGPNGDGGGTCTPKTCMHLGYDCGEAVSCGMVINCNANGSKTPDCPAGQVCGGNGMANQCVGGVLPDGGANCTPKTCANLGYDCGLASNGCNATINCNANGSTTTPDCPTGEICGYNGVPNVCGPSSTSSGCDGGATTSLTGYVFDPGNHLPIYNALVYIPVGTPPTPPTGVDPNSPQCGCTAPPAYASAFTDISGKFTLPNPPSGSNVTVVVELGRWQRIFHETINPCTVNNLGGGTAGAAGNLTLPSDHAQGNIPLFAVDTGNVDSLECVLRKMGIADSEFVAPAIVGGQPTAAGRVQFYQGSVVAGGAMAPKSTGTTPDELTLVNTASVMDSYDVILFPCQGNPGTYPRGALTNLATYANVGGRAFTTHYHYDLVDQPSTWAATANWVPDSGYSGSDPNTGYIDTTFTRGQILSQWLAQPIVVGPPAGQIQVNTIRHDFNSVIPPAQRWMYLTNPAIPLHFTFDTPFNQSPTCGRVVYSDFHVENNAVSTKTQFPSECSNAAMTPQEKLLEFMLFDLTSCVAPPTCTPLTCASYPAGTCGRQTDGCGGLTANCGTCVAPQTCGGGGVANMCGAPGSCVPKTCPGQNIVCGPAGDGCGSILQCGNCPPGQVCVSGQCYAPDAGPPMCIPKTCAQQNIQCGLAGDGCGNIITCPACPTGQKCNSSGQCMSGPQ